MYLLSLAGFQYEHVEWRGGSGAAASCLFVPARLSQITVQQISRWWPDHLIRLKREHGEGMLSNSVTAPATVSGEQPQRTPLNLQVREGLGKRQPASQETCHLRCATHILATLTWAGRPGTERRQMDQAGPDTSPTPFRPRSLARRARCFWNERLLNLP